MNVRQRFAQELAMSIFAQLEQQRDPTNRRGSPRHRLLLEAAGPTDTRVVIHDLSQAGLLIETSASLSAGTSLEIRLPEATTAHAEVVWVSGRFFGCRFNEPISRATLSAARLRGQANLPSRSQASSDDPDIAYELQTMSAQVRQLRRTVDNLIDDLRSERRRRNMERTRLWSAAAPKTVSNIEPEVPDEALADDRLSFGMRLRIILAMTIGSWALILWAFGFF